MSPDVIRGYLRGAVAAGLIDGWYRHMPFQGVEWIVNPIDGPCESYDHEGITAYCRMLLEADVKPRYPRPAVRRYE